MHDTLIDRQLATAIVAFEDAECPRLTPEKSPGGFGDLESHWRSRCWSSLLGGVCCLRFSDDCLVFGHDLLPSYAAGVFVSPRRAAEHVRSQGYRSRGNPVHRAIATGYGPALRPRLNPPFYAWVFVPLAAMPYRAVLAVFTATNLCILGLVFWMLRQFVVATPAQGPIRRVCSADDFTPVFNLCSRALNGPRCEPYA